MAFTHVIISVFSGFCFDRIMLSAVAHRSADLFNEYSGNF